MGRKKVKKDPFAKVLAGKIKDARNEAGLSQGDLAELIGLSDKAISAYEVGRAYPNLQIIREISDAVHKPVSYFLEDVSDVQAEIHSKLIKIEQELTKIKELLNDDSALK